MKKTFLILAALTLNVALWTQTARTIDNVAHIDADGQPQTADNVNKNGMKQDK